MAKKKTIKSKPTQHSDPWRLNAMRLTAFPIQHIQLSEKDWVSAVGVEPEQVSLRPMLMAGAVDDRRLTISDNAGRLEFLLMPKPTLETPSPGLADMGTFDEVLKELLRITRFFFDLKPSVSRLAFGAVLIQRVSDRKAGYSVLKTYLKDLKTKDLTGIRDLFFQINRPRLSKTVGLKKIELNRLTKWNFLEMRQMQFAIGQQAFITGSDQVLGSAVRLELDINTIPEHKDEIPPAKLGTLFKELTELGREIAINGDIP